jgi:hypothetical protein
MEHWQQGHEALIGHTAVKVAAIPTPLALLAGTKKPEHDTDMPSPDDATKLYYWRDDYWRRRT